MITDAARLREQECDRIKAMVTELRKVGGVVSETTNGFTIFPAPAQLHGAVIETYNDHVFRWQRRTDAKKIVDEFPNTPEANEARQVIGKAAK